MTDTQGGAVALRDFDVEYAVFQNDEWSSSSSDAADSEHCALFYEQDGPVERKTVVTFTFDGFLDRAAILDQLFAQPNPSQQAGTEGSENARLRAVVSEVATLVGRFIAPDASVAFIELLPSEVSFKLASISRGDAG